MCLLKNRSKLFFSNKTLYGALSNCFPFLNQVPSFKAEELADSGSLKRAIATDTTGSGGEGKSGGKSLSFSISSILSSSSSNKSTKAEDNNNSAKKEEEEEEEGVEEEGEEEEEDSEIEVDDNEDAESEEERARYKLSKRILHALY